MARCGILVILVALILLGLAPADEAIRWVKEPSLTFDGKSRKWQVRFELNTPTNVEVAIVETGTGRVVRHLAAGVLGPRTPAPLAANTLAQSLEWDGRDDYRQPVAEGAKLAVRVRVGMGVELKQVVGGDPYAYFSRETGHGDHGPWGINGLEVKPDGKVYVLGHSSILGPPALRQYDSEGNYLRTVFPPPAGKDPKAMTGWGINLKPDGTYTPKFNRLTDPSLSTTFLDTHTNGMARMFPSPHAQQLGLWHTGFGSSNFETMRLNTDGTIAAETGERLTGPLVKNPPLAQGPVAPNSHVVHSMVGPVFTCLAPDGKHFYLSGIFAATTRYGSILEIPREGYWRDGQVWKVDLATRTARPFFGLEAQAVAEAPRDRKSAIGGKASYAALHGVTVDKENRVFVCDRLNRRIVVLDPTGKLLREIPVENPDAVAISSRTGALYVTTRTGSEHTGRGQVDLLKFADWQKDTKPSVSLRLSETGYTSHHKHSYVALCEKEAASLVWVAYTEMPVRVYRDDATGLHLVKDFATVPGAQKAFVMDRIEVDPKTESVYMLDDHAHVWKVGDWQKPEFTRVPLRTASIAIDPRRRHLFIRTLADGSSSNSVGKIARHALDQSDYPPENLGDTGSNRLTPAIKYEWCFTGNSDRGFAVAPNGNLALLAQDDGGALQFYHGDDRKVPWESLKLASLGTFSGGIQFDLAGNLYIGHIDRKQPPLPGFKGDPFAEKMGRIHRYAPTGSLESGNLFPKAPEGPTHTYDVPFGAFDADCIVRTPRFHVDGYGRICYPTNIAQRVTLVDNAGNEILAFGTYGNRDSMGGLAGDLVPTPGVPMGFPNSVVTTDDYLYVGDMVNQRLLRLRKTFRLEVTSR